MTSSVSEWWSPACLEVSPGIFRIPLAMPNDGLRAINAYAVDAPDGLALVDSGWHVPSALGELESALASIGRTTSEVTDVYVTHIHRDHYTLAPELRRRFGTRVHLARLEAPGLRAIRDLASNVPISSLRELERAGAGDLVGEIVAMTQDEPFDAADWEDPDVWMDPGPLDLGGRHVEVVGTPGHTKGHVVLHDLDAGLMFTGDHVLPTITPSIGFELGEWDRPLGDYLSSLALLLSRPDARMLPAHGHAGGSVHARVLELLEHHEQRLEEILAVVRAAGGRATGTEVATRLLWTRRRRAFSSLDTFNQMIAICETLAHLDVLTDRGALRSGAQDSPVAAFVA